VPYRIAEAVAFGDFLRGAPQAQAADVGVLLASRDAPAGHSDTRKVAKVEKGIRQSRQTFLKDLRARDLKISLVPYQPWMSQRSHINLLADSTAKPKPRPSRLK
jgi:hypothetical protein